MGLDMKVLKNCITGNCHLTLHALFNVTADKDSFILVFFSTSKNFFSGLLFFSFFHSYVLPEISLSCASTKTHTQCTKSYRIKFVHPQTEKCAASHSDRHIYLYNRRHWQIYHRCVLSGLNAKALFFKWKVKPLFIKTECVCVWLRIPFRSSFRWILMSWSIERLFLREMNERDMNTVLQPTQTHRERSPSLQQWHSFPGPKSTLPSSS